MAVAARKFEDLIVWQKAHRYVISIYQATKRFPKEETYGLVSQMRRAAVSIPANIAEGFKKISKAEKAHYLNIAQSSLEETRYYLILSNDLGLCDNASMGEQAEEISKLLTSYHAKIMSP